MPSERANKLKIQHNKIKSLRKNRVVVESGLVSSYLEENADKATTIDVIDEIEINFERYSRQSSIDEPVTVSRQECLELLNELDKQFGEEEFSTLIDSCRQSVISSIAGPFGLGKFVSNWDKKGGNIDTIHNVRNGVYATEEEKSNYDNRGDYQSELYHNDTKYIDKGKKDKEKLEKGELQDDYSASGKIFSPSDQKDGQNKRNIDHVISAKNIHEDPGRVLAGAKGSDLANKEENLQTTTASVNKAKKDKTVSQFIEDNYSPAAIDKRNAEIKRLESKGNDRTHKEESELKKLKNLEDVDTKKLKNAGENAQKILDREINVKYYSSSKFASKVITTGVKEAGRMGFQQFVGGMLVEFFAAAFDEVIDVYKNDFTYKFNELTQRFNRVMSRLIEKWKNVLHTSLVGTLSGFFSNLVTTLINSFITTGKRMVRIIREGFFSILKAFKTIVFPPDNCNKAEALDAALKLIISGVLVSIGVLVEESLEKLIDGLSPVLIPLAPMVSAAISGAITGVSCALVVYGLDKMDFFNVNKNKRNNKTLKMLDEMIKECDKRITLLVDQAMNPYEKDMQDLLGC